MAMSSATLILMFVIYVCYIVMTQSAGNEGNWNYLGTPRPDDRIIKRMMESRQQKNVGSSSRSKKGRNDEGSSTARGRSRRSERTEEAFEPEPERGDITTKIVRGWTNEEQRALLRLAYTTSVLKGPKRGHEFDWRLIEKSWNEEQNHRIFETLKKKLQRMLDMMRPAAQKFDAKHGWAPWPEELNHIFLKIYFNTEGGDKAGHGERILAEWRRERLPGYEQLSSKDLIERAGKVLGSVMKFDLSNPRGRTTMLHIGEPVEWKTEHNECFRQLLIEHPYYEPNRLKNICEEAQKIYPGLAFVPNKRIYEHLRHAYPQLLIPPPVTFDSVGGSIHDTTHSRYHSFMGDYNSTALSLVTHSHYGGMAGTSSHPVQSYDQPNLNLHLNTHNVDEHNPDIELRLGYPPHREGYH